MAYETKHRRGIKLFQSGDLRRAERILTQVLAKEETAERWNDWATIQVAMGNHVEASRGYCRALELQPEDVEISANLGVLLAGHGLMQAALPFLVRGAACQDEKQRTIVQGLLNECRGQRQGVPAQKA